MKELLLTLSLGGAVWSLVLLARLADAGWTARTITGRLRRGRVYDWARDGL